MIQTLFDKPTARIKVNGDLTAPLTQHKGCRQGCAVSFFLFAIFIKHRNEKVFNHHGKPQLALFADDVFFFLIYIFRTTHPVPIQTDVLPGGIWQAINSKKQVLRFNYEPTGDIIEKLQVYP